jgi:hypothetical protein
MSASPVGIGALPGPATRLGPGSTHAPFRLPAARRFALIRACGQGSPILGNVAARTLQMLWTTWGQIDSILLCFLAREAVRHSHQRQSQIQPKHHDHGLRLTRPCGKDRTGFPQAGGACPLEIPHPVDPETWKRCYTVNWRSSGAFTETEMCDLYWTGGVVPTLAASGPGLYQRLNLSARHVAT